MSFDEQSQVSALPLATLGQMPRFVIGVDYGTTYTGVAWILTEGKKPTINDIKLVTKWPRSDGGIAIQGKVPSVFTYSANTGTSWGYGIGHDAYVIRWTKLELEPPKLLDALESLKRTLMEASHLDFNDEDIRNSRVPRHLQRSPVEVMTDYLAQVARCVFDHIVSQKDRQMLKDYPVDFVITHPAIWHQRAVDFTFKAVTKAFERRFQPGEVKLGNIRLASEPEACAQYTMRYALETGTLDLRRGECFTVVDAGGGTIDLVSYRVDQVSPHFRMTRITPPSGGAYGATRVDDYFFKTFLPRRLKPEDYAKLTSNNDRREKHGQGSHKVLSRGEQAILDSFLTIKHNFAGPRPPSEGPQRPILLDIPKWLGIRDDHSNGIRNNQLMITNEEMVDMFQLSVDKTIELIQGQIALVDDQGLRVETIFLSGGFSMSEYLFSRVQGLARGWDINLVKAQDSWTAVAKGAVLMGLGVGCEVPPVAVKCPVHIGVIVAPRYAIYDHEENQKYVDSFDQVPRAKHHIHWIVSRGDPINSRGFHRSLTLIRKMLRKGARTGKVTVITTNDDDERGPGNNAATRDITRNEVELDYDLDAVQTDTGIWQKNTARSVHGNVTYHKVEMQLEVYISQAGANFHLLWGKEVGFMGGTGAPGISLAHESYTFPQNHAVEG